MKNINNYDSFLNEYYKGKNKTVGFKYSDAEVPLDVEFYAGIDDEMTVEYFEEIIDTYFNSIFDKHTKMVDTIASSEKDEINQFIQQEIGADGFTDVYSVDVKFDGFADTEAYSMLDALQKKMHIHSMI